jgi:4-carboxymuconolactone decarboxylase
MTTSSKDIHEDLARFRDTYVELFGMLPPLPAARFEFLSEINPEFLRLSERLRAHAFYSDVFDIKTTAPYCDHKTTSAPVSAVSVIAH